MEIAVVTHYLLVISLLLLFKSICSLLVLPGEKERSPPHEEFEVPNYVTAWDGPE